MNKVNCAGDEIYTSRSNWSFESIASNFDNHIQKSVPLYNQARELALNYSDFFIHKSSNVLDIGCSLEYF